MKRSEVYSWRLTPELKSRLERAARERGASLAHLLEEIVKSWLEARPSTGEEQERQRRLHRAAEATFGTVHGGDPERSTRARERIRTRLSERRGD